jgi:hypothetical protein
VRQNQRVPDPEAVITWKTRPAPALEFTASFGVFAGREVSPREIERLSSALLPLVSSVSISAEHRFEVGADSTVALHQVRVEVPREALPEREEDIESLRARLAETIKEWLNDSLTGVSGQELTHAELLARDAVVEGMLEKDS